MEHQIGGERESHSYGAMKKKNDMARECAERLEPFGKTIKDATDFYVRYLTPKKSPGRPKDSSPFADALDWSDIRKQVAGDQFKTALVYQFKMALQQRPIKTVFASLPSQTTAKLREQRKAQQAAMSEAERKQRMRKRDATATAYERFLENNPVPTDLSPDKFKQEIKERFAKFLLTPAGKFTDAMARDILKPLEKRELPDGRWEVEKRIFPSLDDATEAIHRFAKQIKFELRKQH